MKTSILFAPALIGALFMASCSEQTTTTETTTTGDTAVMMNTTTPTVDVDPNMTTTSSTTTVTTDQSTTVGIDSTTGQQVRADARSAGQDIKEGYKDARDATGDAAGKVGHDVKQGYKNTRDDVKAGVDAAKENKERR